MAGDGNRSEVDVTAPREAEDRSTSTGAADATTGSTVLSGGLWNSLSTVLPPLFILLQSVAAARFLGPDRLGVQTYIAWAALSLSMLLTVGLSRALSRYIALALGARAGGDVGSLVRWAWRVQAGAALAGGGLLLTVAATSHKQSLVWSIVAGVVFLSALQTVPAAVLIAMQRWRAYTLIGLVTGIVGSVATVAVLAAGGGIAGMFAVELVVVLINLVWALALVRRAIPPQSDDSRHVGLLVREVRGYAVLATVQAVLTLIVWRRSEIFLIEHFAPVSQVAVYSIAFGIVFAVQQLPAGLVGALTPAIATLLGAGQIDRIRSGVARALRLALLFSLPVTAGLLAVGPDLVEVVYGADYTAAGPVLLVLVLVLPLVTVADVGGAVLHAYGQIRQMIVIGLVATVIDVVLALLLIPDHGAMGAAVANAAAQATLAGLRVVLAVRAVGGTDWEPVVLLRALLASSAAGLAGWLPIVFIGGGVGLVTGVLAGVLVFAGLAVPLRVLPVQDAAWLRRMAGPRLGGLVGRVCDRYLSMTGSR